MSKKITQFDEDTTPSSDDLLLTVNDPGGTPINKKVTIGNLFANAPDITTSDLITKGPWIDSRAYDTLEEANTAAYNSGKLLVVSQNYTLTTNTTLTAAVKVLKSGGFTKASTYTLAINGPFEAGLYQVFSGFSAGDVTFAKGSVKEVIPLWWQENTNPGTTDMALALRCAVAAVGSYGPTVYCPSGTYYLSSVVNQPLFGNANLWINVDNPGLTLRGDPGGTIFVQQQLPLPNQNQMIGVYPLGTKHAYPPQNSDIVEYDFNSCVARSFSITLSTPGDASHFSSGDIVYIHRELIPGFDNEYIGEQNQVIDSNATTGVVTLAYPLVWDYTGSTRKISNVDSVTVKDLTIDGIEFRHYVVAMGIGTVWNLTVKNCVFRSTGGSYGAIGSGMISNALVEGNAWYQGQSVTEGNPWDFSWNSSRIRIRNNLVYSSTYGFAGDEAASDFEITDNLIFVNGNGTDPGDFDAGLIIQINTAVISNNLIVFRTTVVNHSAIQAYQLLNYNHIITDNIILSNSPQVINAAAPGVIISGNRIWGTFNIGIDCPAVRGVVVGNSIELVGDSVGWAVLLGTASVVDQIVQGNTILRSDSGTAGAIRVNSPGGSSPGPVIVGNYINGFQYGIYFQDGMSYYQGAKVTENNIANTTTPYHNCLTKNRGLSSAIATGGTIAHGLAGTPTSISVTAADSGPTDIYCSADATNITVNFGGGGSHTFYWAAEYVP
jgi:hypothetical protein